MDDWQAQLLADMFGVTHQEAKEWFSQMSFAVSDSDAPEAVLAVVERYDERITIDLTYRQAIALYWSIDPQRAKGNGHYQEEDAPVHVPPSVAFHYARAIESALAVALVNAGALRDPDDD